MNTIAIVSTNETKYSETFIRNHVLLLPAEVHYLFNGYLPTHVKTNWDEKGTPLLKNQKQGWIQRLFNSEKENTSKQLTDAIKHYLLKNKVEAVLAEYGPSGVKMMDICADCNIPLVVHFFGYDAYRNDIMSSFGSQYPEMFEKAAAIIAASKPMKKRMEQLGANPSKVHCLPCGIETDLYYYHDVSKHPPRFIAASRFADTKAPHLTILAFAKVLEKIPEATLAYFGKGYLWESCKLLVKALKMENAVDFKGVVSNEELSREMAASRIFVQHSITTPSNDREGLPLAILGASATGLPIVSTIHAGIPDAIIHGETGFLVAEGDIDGMAYYMIQLAEDDDLVYEMGKKGAAFTLKNYTIEDYINNLWGVISSCI